MQAFIRTTILLFLLVTSHLAIADNVNHSQRKEIVSGQEFNLYSKVLGEDRKLLVRLPEGYSQSDRAYPVLITMDGETQFHHIAGTVDWLSERSGRIPRLIVVAVTNTHRGRDMTAGHNGGGSPAFRQFIASELIPFVDKEFRTQPFRILVGHSMTGYFALNVFEKSPELFNAYIAMSPWFLQDEGEVKLINMLRKRVTDETLRPTFIFSSIGDEPNLSARYEEFVATLNARTDNIKWQNLVSKDDNHMSIASATINRALQFVFGAMQLTPDSAGVKHDVESIQAYFKDISENLYGYHISPEATINRFGYTALFREQDAEKAIEYFKANVKLYPNSPNVYDSLADGYLAKQDYVKASKALDKAIEISKRINAHDQDFYIQRKARVEKQMAEESAG